MSTTTILNQRKAIPVNIGDMQLYCEEFSASASRTVSEAATVTGDAALTGTFPRSAKLTMKGRAFDEDAPLSFLLMLNDMLRSPQTLTVEYRGLFFGDCRVLSYSVGDSGENYTDISVTLSSADIYSAEE